MACALLSGTAHTGRELARHVGIAPSTASEHLGHLLAAGLIAVEAQGRHRYYRLAGRQIADLLETMMVAPATTAPLPAVPSGLAFARSCYDHLAGELGVRLHDRFIALGAIAVTAEGATLTATGRDLLAKMDVGVERSRTRPAVRQCLDWSQRRHHLAGTVGAGLLAAMSDRRWIYPSATRTRELRLSEAGRRGLRVHLGMEFT